MAKAERSSGTNDFNTLKSETRGDEDETLPRNATNGNEVLKLRRSEARNRLDRKRLFP